MRITVVGTGYVGLVTGTIFAELGNEVTCVDVDPKKVNMLKKGRMPIYEPGLEELVRRNFCCKRLFFTTEIDAPVQASEAIFIAVGTPQDKDGRADLHFVKEVAQEVGQALKKMPDKKRFFKMIVNKSTVPVGTGDIVQSIIKKFYAGPFEVVSNPEFLREGQAIHDCMYPDRIVIGLDDGEEKVKTMMKEIYRPVNAPILFTDLKSAELIKYASNSFLALSISYINSIASLCEKIGGNIEDIASGMKLDRRIGRFAFLSAGIGYGGSCFPKDVKALIRTADDAKFDFKILKDTELVNENQKKSVVSKLKKLIGSNLKGKKIALWGLTFKPKTDDLREAVSLVVVKSLLKSGAKVRAYDPIAMPNAKKEYPKISYAKNVYDTVKDADALAILTEWSEFSQVDLKKVRRLMKNPNVYDGRNIFKTGEMKKLGFNYLRVGQK